MRDVAVIGCGSMGSALVRALAQAGLEVTAWNRTSDKAVALAGPRVTAAATAEDAVRSAPLVIAVVSTYEAAREVLDPIGDWDGRTLVNLVTGAPADAEQLDRWVRERHGTYLDGAILAYPRDIGTDDAILVYSGPDAVWATHQPVLYPLGGRSRHISARPSAANVLDVAATGAFHTVALGAFVEATAYAAACGVTPSTFLDAAEPLLEPLRLGMREAAEAIAAERHETDQATIDVYLQAAEAWRDAMRTAGQRAALLSAEVDNLKLAAERGHGKQGFFAQARTAALLDRKAKP